jgi:CheY-like chemotaxis protein
LAIARSTILIVEDEPMIRLSAADDLQALGFQVFEADNADVAMALLERNPAIEVLFTDIQMPGTMDGMALAALVGKRWPDIVIVITSGQVRPNPAQLAGCTRFVSKPYVINDLVAIFDRGSGRDVVGSAPCDDRRHP